MYIILTGHVERLGLLALADVVVHLALDYSVVVVARHVVDDHLGRVVAHCHFVVDVPSTLAGGKKKAETALFYAHIDGNQITVVLAKKINCIGLRLRCM